MVAADKNETRPRPGRPIGDALAPRLDLPRRCRGACFETRRHRVEREAPASAHLRDGDPEETGAKTRC